MQDLNRYLSVFLVFWPMVAMLLVWSLPARYSRIITLGAALLSLAGTVHALYYFDTGAGVQFDYRAPWINTLFANFSVGMDGISLLMVLLTNILMPIIVISTTTLQYPKPRLFYSMTLLMQAALIGVFVAQDMILYYIFWELALIPIYIIVLNYGGANRLKVATKFFIYTIFGSLLMLLAIAYMKINPGPYADMGIQQMLFGAFFVTFAIKIPIFPFHNWQADTYTEAPSQGSMLLSGIMLKMGLYSMIRYVIPQFPAAVLYWQDTVIVLAVIGVAYGAWMAITQSNIKRLIAFSSFSHVGLIAAGLFTISGQGMQGGLIQMFAHGINVVGLFLVAQIIQERLKTHDLDKMGGIIHKAPWFAGFFLITLLGSVALPLTNGFIGEFMLLNAVFTFNPVLATIGGLTVIFSAVYMLRAYQKSMLGPENPANENFIDLRPKEVVLFISIGFLVLFMGVYPKPFFELTQSAVDNILQEVKNKLK